MQQNICKGRSIFTICCYRLQSKKGCWTCAFKLLREWSILLVKELSTETWQPGIACRFRVIAIITWFWLNYAMTIRMDMNFVIKVADFGLAESLDSSKEYFRQDQENAIKLPIKWLAPESIHDKVFSERSDVVSLLLLQFLPIFISCCTWVASMISMMFGVTMLRTEIVT